MRNPAFWRNFGLGIVASGLAIGAAVILLPDSTLGVNAKTGLFCYALLAAIFGSMWTSWRHSEAVAQNALRRGEGVLAQWRVGPATWERFATLNDTFSVNELKVRRPDPAAGIEVIVGRHAVFIDGYVHKLIWPPQSGFGSSGTGNWHVETASILPADPSCVNLRVRMTGAKGPPVYSNLVFPIAAEAEPIVQRAIPWTQ